MNRDAVVLLAVVGGIFLASSAFTKDRQAHRLSTIEGKLWGSWVGGDCQGELTLRSGGRFERQHYSPGNNTLAGTWQIRWDELPPTLTLTCESSDDTDRYPFGRTWDIKVVELSGDTLVFQYSGEPKSRVVYERSTKAKDQTAAAASEKKTANKTTPDKPAKRLESTAEPLTADE